MKILIVEQNIESLKEFKTFLIEEKCNVIICNFQNAENKIINSEFDCVLISVFDQFENVLKIIEKLNQQNRTDGIIILSNNQNSEFIVQCFDSGADDYLDYGYQNAVFFARMKAIIRRKKFKSTSKLYFANLVVDFQSKQVFVWDMLVNLTKKEYEILLHLIANKNCAVTKEAIIENVWNAYPRNLSSYDFLFAHIKNLKNKLKTAKADLVIKNTYGLGYQIEEL